MINSCASDLNNRNDNDMIILVGRFVQIWTKCMLCRPGLLSSTKADVFASLLRWDDDRMETRMRFDRRNLARRKKFSTTRWPSIVFGNPRLLPKDVHSTVQEYPTALSVDSDRYLDLHQNRGVAKFLYEIFSTYPVTVAAALLRPTGVRTSTRAQAQR